MQLKKKYAAMVLALPTLAMLGFIGYTLPATFEVGSLWMYLIGILFFPFFFIVGIPAYVWVPLSFVGFGTGTWLLLASRSRVLIGLGIFLSMLPVLTIVLGFFFSGYQGP